MAASISAAAAYQTLAGTRIADRYDFYTEQGELVLEIEELDNGYRLIFSDDTSALVDDDALIFPERRSLTNVVQ